MPRNCFETFSTGKNFSEQKFSVNKKLFKVGKNAKTSLIPTFLKYYIYILYLNIVDKWIIPMGTLRLMKAIKTSFPPLNDVFLRLIRRRVPRGMLIIYVLPSRKICSKSGKWRYFTATFQEGNIIDMYVNMLVKWRASRKDITYFFIFTY